MRLKMNPAAAAIVSACAILLSCVPPVDPSLAGAASAESATFTHYTGAYSEPLKGYRGDIWDKLEYDGVQRHYIKWNEIENVASDGVDKVKAFCDAAWGGLRERNVKVIPRVYLEWPDAGTYWPSDLASGDYSSDAFKARVEALVRKLGEAWDLDPRVAYIQMGIIGLWGEHHDPAPDAAMQKLLGDAFARYFPHKKVQIRNYWEFTDYSFGIYWDSFAHLNQEDHARGIMALGERWKTMPIGGEAAYNWGDFAIQPGDGPDDTLTDPVHFDWFMDRVRRLHANELGWFSLYDPAKPGVSEKAALVQNALGYHLVPVDASWWSIVMPGSTMQVSFRVRNEGSAPCYAAWPVAAALIPEGGGEPAWQGEFSGCDASTFMPGDGWIDAENRYAEPAQVYEVSTSFPLPAKLARGRYYLAVSVLDPASGKPSLRFAATSYLKGGWTVVGGVGVGTLPPSGLPAYADIAADKSLSY